MPSVGAICQTCQKNGNQIGLLSVETGLVTQIRGQLSPRGFIVQERQRYQSSLKFFELFKNFHKKGLAPPQRTQNPQMGKQNFEKIEIFQNFTIFVFFQKKNLDVPSGYHQPIQGTFRTIFRKFVDLKKILIKKTFSGFWTFCTLFKGKNTRKMSIFA